MPQGTDERTMMGAKTTASNGATVRTLVLDDDLDAPIRSLLEGLLTRVAERSGRRITVDYAPTWNTRGQEPVGLHAFQDTAYDLVVLDMVFQDQAHQGYEIYDCIRSGEALGHLASDSRCRVPIILFSWGEGEARSAISLVSTSALYTHTFILYKDQLLSGETNNVERSLCAMWTGMDLVMHILIPTAPSRVTALAENMMIAFGVVGGSEPAPEDYARRPRSSYRIIRDAVDPKKPPGKKDWCFEIHSMDMSMVMSLRDLNKLFMEQTGRANLAHKHPAGALGLKLIDGVAEIHFHFQDRDLFDLDVQTLVLSRLPGGRLFVEEEFWE